MAPIDQNISTYLIAIEIEGKTPLPERLWKAELTSELAEVLKMATVLVAGRCSPAAERAQGTRRRGSPRTREVRAFFSWCLRMDMVESNVFSRVPLAKQEKKIRLPFEQRDVVRLLGTLDRSSLKGCRDYALILFLLDTGVRVGECAIVRIEEVDWEEGQILVHGKGQKQRHVGMSPTTSEALREYVSGFRGDAPGPLFLTREGHPFADENAFRVGLRRIAVRAGVANVHPHRFRRTFATWAIESGAHETDVMLLLGHTTLAMTHHYAQTYTSQQAVRAHGAMSPVARLDSLRSAGQPTCET